MAISMQCIGYLAIYIIGLDISIFFIYLSLRSATSSLSLFYTGCIKKKRNPTFKCNFNKEKK